MHSNHGNDDCYTNLDRLRNNASNANRRSDSAGTGFASRYNYNLSPPQPFTINLRYKICPHCSAQLFESELKLKSTCCGKGDTRLPESCQLDPFPSPLFELFASQHPGSSNFWEYIRRFNSAFSFASFGAESSTPPGRGPYCYRIHGQTYHRTGILHNETGTTPSFAQIYILEGNGIDCKVTDNWLYCYLSSLFDMSQMFNLIEIEFDKWLRGIAIPASFLFLSNFGLFRIISKIFIHNTIHSCDVRCIITCRPFLFTQLLPFIWYKHFHIRRAKFFINLFLIVDWRCQPIKIVDPKQEW